jgi:hypothetical protein
MIDVRVLWDLARATVVLTMTAAAIGCSAGEPTPSSDAQRDVEVFKAVVRSEICHAYRSYAVVSDRPEVSQFLEIPERWLLSSDLREKALKRAEQAESWPHVEICTGAHVVADSKVAEIFEREKTKPKSWRGFYAAFPGAAALVRVSAPIFTVDGNAAIVYIDKQCDMLCGGGFNLELKKSKDGWEVVRRDLAWMA